jgi:hypothetical protein
MAKPPRSAALNEESAPLIFPMGVRAPATMYEPAICISVKSDTLMGVGGIRLGDESRKFAIVN